MRMFKSCLLSLSTSLEKFPKNKNAEKINLTQGLLVGLAQVLALIPGISRSGMTISAGMFQGIKRHKAAEFSFLLGTVAIFAATSYVSMDICKSSSFDLPINLLISGFISSFVTSFVCIHFLLKFLKKHTLHVFSIYLIIISALGFYFFT